VLSTKEINKHKKKNKMIMRSRDDNNDRCIIAVLTDSYNHSTNYASTYLVPAMHLRIEKIRACLIIIICNLQR